MIINSRSRVSNLLFSSNCINWLRHPGHAGIVGHHANCLALGTPRGQTHRLAKEWDRRASGAHAWRRCGQVTGGAAGRAAGPAPASRCATPKWKSGRPTHTGAIRTPKRSKPGAARPNFDGAALLMTNDEDRYRSRACTIVRPMRSRKISGPSGDHLPPAPNFHHHRGRYRIGRAASRSKTDLR